MFYYIPLEPLQERYTQFLSDSDGIVETQLRNCDINYRTIKPNDDLQHITTGRVLDPLGRTRWGFSQTETLVRMIQQNEITRDDVIYFEDFWHPGFEMIPYTLCVAIGNNPKAWPKMYAFCHAQSVDPNDFTWPMRWWMRDIESSWARINTQVYVAAPELRDMLSDSAVIPDWKVKAVGTVFDSSVLRQYISRYDMSQPRHKTVVFSSRWDTEKDPRFYMNLVREVLTERDDVEFLVCSGFKRLQSNDPALVTEAYELADAYENGFSIITDLTKNQYYKTLNRSSVQFNCAHQDFVSYTLLEAATFGCSPLYPNYLTFPAALHYETSHLYKKRDLQDAKEKLYALLDNPVDRNYSWIYRKYEDSFKRMLKDMGYLGNQGFLSLPIALRMTKDEITKFYQAKEGEVK